MAKEKAKPKSKKTPKEVVEEPTLEDLEKEELQSPDEPETESLEARVETETKQSTPEEDAEGTFMSVDAAEQRNVKPSDLNLDTNAMGIQTDEFICSVCFLILSKVQLAKPRAKVCIDCT